LCLGAEKPMESIGPKGGGTNTKRLVRLLLNTRAVKCKILDCFTGPGILSYIDPKFQHCTDRARKASCASFSCSSQNERIMRQCLISSIFHLPNYLTNFEEI
jgi:hypothetical protein